MPGQAPLLWLAALAGIAGVALLRFAWSRKERSPALNGGGWALLLAAAVAGGFAAGAWGVAVASLFAMGAACLFLALAAAGSPPGKATASNRRVGLLPEAGEPRRIGRRVATFLIVALGALAASVALSVAIKALGDALGWREADALATALFAMPVIWAALAFAVLVQERRKAQLLILLACFLPLLPVLVSGA